MLKTFEAKDFNTYIFNGWLGTECHWGWSLIKECISKICFQNCHWYIICTTNYSLSCLLSTGLYINMAGSGAVLGLTNNCKVSRWLWWPICWYFIISLEQWMKPSFIGSRNAYAKLISQTFRFEVYTCKVPKVLLFLFLKLYIASSKISEWNWRQCSDDQQRALLGWV